MVCRINHIAILCIIIREKRVMALGHHSSENIIHSTQQSSTLGSKPDVSK